MKKLFSAALCAVLLLSLCGCSIKTTTLSLDKTKILTNYTAEYKVTAEAQQAEQAITYKNIYTVSLDSEKDELVISSTADEPWNNQKEGEDYVEGRQIITTLSRLQYSDTENATFGMPNYVEEEFSVSVEESFYTKFTFKHDHALKAGILTTKEYSSSSETGFEEKVYSVTLEEQYFDKDSLAFIIGAFPEDGGTVKVSSGNRDSLQAVVYECLENEAITTSAGTFTCKVIRLRPATDFSVNSARFYIDTETGLPVKVMHDSSVMELQRLELQ